MFALNIPSTFGDTIDCRINGKPKRVTWRDEHTLVIESDPYATAPVDTDKFGANWTGLETLASQLRGDCTAREIFRPANVVVEFKNRSNRNFS
jgi:hypothetical protein